MSHDPLTPPAPPVALPAPAVTLYGAGGPQWRPVSPRLATARTIVAAGVAAPVALLVLVLGLTLWRPLLLGLLVVGVGLVWVLWVIRRQVPAITWAEDSEELVIRRGRMFRTLVSVPYGRLQFVDMQSGPLSRRLGLARLELHTASPHSQGHIPGLPEAEAEALRERLTARGESQRAGL